MKKLLTGIFIFGFVIMASGQEINNYKYIIIPESFNFSEEVDKYRLNSMTKFLFEKNGFNTLMNTQAKPEDFNRNRCLGLQARLHDNSGLFVTKVTLKLLDCNDQVIFETKEGRSREKDFQESYQEALRDAFSSIEKVDYHFEEVKTNKKGTLNKEIVTAPVVASKEPVEERVELVETEMNKSSKADAEIIEIAIEEREFRYSEKAYNLKETSQGLGLFQEKSSDPIAILIETNGGQSYIYNSLTNQGVAYFDEDGNLIVEYFNKQENKKKTLVYKLVN